MIGIGIGVSWAKQAISVVTNLLVSFKARVASYPNSIFEAEPCLAGQLTELNRDGLLNGASLVITPNAYNEGVLYDVVPNTTLGDMTVTRATTATRVNAEGLVELVPVNLLQYSEQFNNAVWDKLNTTVTSNTTISPDGTQDADSMALTDSGSRVSANLALGAGTYTLSFYVKKLSTTSGSTMRLVAVVDTLTVQSIFTPTEEWVRYSYTFTATSSVTVAQVRAQSLIGNVAIWGAQLVTGSVEKDYFPTTTRLNIPRLDYTGSTCPSLLIEPQRTNLLLRSEEFDLSPWGKTATTTVTANSVISPDGTQDADNIFATEATDYINQVYSGSIGVVYTFSLFVKNNDSISSKILLRTLTTAVDARLNWSGSTLTSITNVTGTSTFQNYGNGWYRVTSTYTSVEASQTLRIYPVLLSANPNKSVYVWGAQLEVGPNATSYIPTTTATVTRNADNISKTGISDLIGQTEGTLYIEVNFKNWESQNRVLAIGDGTASNRILILQGGNSNTFRLLIANTGTTQADIISSAYSIGNYKIAVGYKNNDIALYINGLQIGTENSATIPACSNLYLGKVETTSSSGNLNNSIKSAALWKTRLTNAELATLTTL